MNLLRTFESRVSDAFGAAPQGYTAPFSFKRLAKRAAREMEAETFVIDGIDTAPALYTILVSSTDDAAMRALYPQLTREIVDFVKGEADRKGYDLVGEPLARFMVDPSLRSGKFAVFAENVDRTTLNQLREEEESFLSGSLALGGAAADLQRGRAAKRRPSARTDEPRLRPIPARADQAQPAGSAPVIAAAVPSPDDSASMGLDVIPMDYLEDQLASSPVAPSPAPATVRRSVPLVNPRRVPAADGTPDEPRVATCLLVDHQGGQTYTATSPSTLIGRERREGSIVLRDPNVSRIHAELTYDGHVWRVKDLGSTNGTLVNDVEVASKVLRDGDVVTLGLVNLEFREG